MSSARSAHCRESAQSRNASLSRAEGSENDPMGGEEGASEATESEEASFVEATEATDETAEAIEAMEATEATEATDETASAFSPPVSAWMGGFPAAALPANSGSAKAARLAA